MLPAYKETLYMSPSGNTLVYIKRNTSKKKISDRKKEMLFQKFLGLCLFIIVIASTILLKDGTCLFVSLMGITRIIY